LDIFKKSDIFGEMGLIDGLPRFATVTAFEDCVISILSQEIFNHAYFESFAQASQSHPCAGREFSTK